MNFDRKRDVLSGPFDGATTTSVLKPDKAGYLYIIPSKTFLNREKWKRRYFALQGSKLYRFHKKEDVKNDTYSSKCRFIGLESYDVCLPDKESDDFKRRNVFLLVASELIASDTMRHVFAADDEEEMEDWIAYLRRAVSRTREGRRPQRPPRSLRAPQPSSRSERPSSEDNSSSGRLYNPNKYRVRGPKGRRLPQKKHRQTIDVTERFRSTSLCELDMEDEDCVDIDDGQVRMGSSDMVHDIQPPEGQSLLTDRDKSNSIGDLAYRYSSSDEGSSKSKDNLQNSETKIAIDEQEQQQQRETNNQENEVVVVPIPDENVASIGRDRYLSCSPNDGMDFFACLASRLSEMYGSLTRFHKEVQNELGFIQECISLTDKQSVDDKLRQQAVVVLMDLKGTEGELQQLADITDKVNSSLQTMMSHCKEELAKTSDL